MKFQDRIYIGIVLFFLVSWVWNVVRFTSCEFESNYRCEVIHGAGVFVPFLSIFTVWFDIDE